MMGCRGLYSGVLSEGADALAARSWHSTVGGVVCVVGAYNMGMVSCARGHWAEGCRGTAERGLTLEAVAA